MTQVVELLELEPAIVQITMKDEVHKNTFSPELVDGLVKAYDVVNASSEYKVAILTGYDRYFASGGTQKGLLDLAAGQSRFTDVDIYSLALHCPIPVISAMQGHGIGGGFVMGLFSDIVILGRENVYTTNFMRYGFTPGMGATYIVPKKLGLALGHEMLMNAQNFRGEELRQRGVPFTVCPKDEVMALAYRKARELAEKPRVSLITLKNHLVAALREELPAVIEQELAMHELTIHQEEVKEKIQSLF